MSKPFDATTKKLVEIDPAAWLRVAGLLPEGIPVPPVSLVESDISSVSGAADRLIRVEAAPPYAVHFEFQTSYDADMDERTLFYNVSHRRLQAVPVRSVVFLLRRAADGPAITGRVVDGEADSDSHLRFGYHVVRVWQQTPDALIDAGLGTVPLAVVAAVAPEELPAVVRRMQERMDREGVAPGLEGDLWASTSILLGLGHDQAFIARLLQGVRNMKESVTYQAILQEGREEGREEGRAEEARALVLRFGENRFGTPDEGTRAAIAAINDRERLEELVARVFQVESWQELLA